MTYICDNCAHIFEEGEQHTVTEAHGFSDGLVERFEVCPVCGGTYSEANRCNGCGEWHPERVLYFGWCADCLKDRLTPDRALTILTRSDDWMDDLAEMLNEESEHHGGT